MRGSKRKATTETKSTPQDLNKKSKSEQTRNTKSRRSPVEQQESEKGHLTRSKAKELGKTKLQELDHKGQIKTTKPAPRSRQPAETKPEPVEEPPVNEHSDIDDMEPEDSDRNGRPDSDDLDQARQNTLQGLLRRLGAGMEDIFPHGHMQGSARIKNILAMLRDEEEMQQLTGLTELCEYISISTEETLITFPTEQIVPILVSMLGYEHNPDLMLLAARALTLLADIFPPASSSIVRHGAVPAFCARLLTIEYIDLAEQSLQALEKLSHEHRDALLRSGALVAVLSYIDFFQTGVQRVAVATAANICRGVSIEYAEAVATAVPILLNLLQYSDAKIVNSACLALTRITESYSRNATQMEMLCSFGLIGSIVEMVSVSEGGSISSQLSSSTFYGLIKLLATAASGSPLVAKELLGAGVSKTLKNLMDTSPLLSSTGAVAGNALRSSEQLEDLVSLAAQILPAIPATETATTTGGSNSPPDTTCALLAHLTEHPEVATQVATDLLPVLLKVYSSSGTANVKRHSLSAVTKLLFYCPADPLKDLLKDLPVSSWVATLLNSRDPTVAARGMQTAKVLMDKLPDVFSVYFLKEGVVHAMEQLASHAPPTEQGKDKKGGQEPAGGLLSLGVMTRRRSQSHLGGASGGNSEGSSKGKEPAGGGGDGGSARPATSSQQVAVGTGSTVSPTVAASAKEFLAQYFTDDQGNTKGCDTDGVRHLKAVCARLPDPTAVSDLLTTMAATGDEAISTFELLSSGALQALRAHLSGADLQSSSKKLSDEEYQRALLERLAVVVKCALPVGSGNNPPMLSLVQNLLAAFGTLDKFTVRLTSVSMPSYSSMGFYGRSNASAGTSGNSLSSSLAALTNPLKVRLSRATDETRLRDHSSQVVLIEPLASMSQIEDFLWPRVHTSAALADEPGPSRSALPSSAAGGAPSQPPSAAQTEQRQQQQQPGTGSRVTRATRNNTAANTEQQQGAGKATDPSSSRPKASKNRPIPQVAGGRRLTRAQAKAAAEAEMLNMNKDEEESDGEEGEEHDFMSEDEAGEYVIEPPASTDDKEHPLAGDEHQHNQGDVERGHPHDDDDDGEGSESDEEGDYVDDDDYVEGDDYDEDEDEMMDGAAMNVHDMHLGEGGPAAAAGTGTGAAGHPSYARAAASGHRHHHRDEDRRRDDEEPRLAFYVNGRLVPLGSTVFQAVQAATNNNSRLWSDIHTLTYTTYSRAMQLEREKEAAAATTTAAASNTVNTATTTNADDDNGKITADGGVAGGIKASPLFDLPPHPAALAELPDATPELRDALEVLRLLETLNRLAPRLVSRLEGDVGRMVNSEDPPVGQVPRESFAGGRLGPKLAQQLKDAISICSGTLPEWCKVLTAEARFLLPFDVRRRYFYCTALGLPRALLYLQQSHAADHPEAVADRDTAGLRVGRVHRQKVRIARKRLLDSAHKVFELYAAPKSMLEIEFFNEVGTGLGPTLEFYTLLSHELQRKSLNIWRHDPSTASNTTELGDIKPSSATTTTTAQQAGPGPLKGELALAAVGPEGDRMRDKDLVSAPLGLFPSAVPPSQRTADGKTTKTFKLLGRVVAKALQDQRLLDLPLSPVFYRLALGRKVDLFDLRKIDPAMGASVERLRAAHKASLKSSGTTTVMVDGAAVEDLCLTFVLPGRSDYELCPGGTDVAVTSENLGEYVDAVVDATLGSGVAMQIQAFRAGFEELFPLSALKPFYVDEIEAMVCGTGESWTTEGLAAVIKFDHGYTASSPVIKALLEVLVELDPVDQRRFLRFVTGTPRLPPGGLSALQPRLTVVRKLNTAVSGIQQQLSGVDAALATSMPSGDVVAGSLPAGGLPRSLADGDLPSVMTCANYLKLPPYSTKEILKERLMFAFREGQGSFDLS